MEVSFDFDPASQMMVFMLPGAPAVCQYQF
jgi:hypothetical protein